MSLAKLANDDTQDQHYQTLHADLYESFNRMVKHANAIPGFLTQDHDVNWEDAANQFNAAVAPPDGEPADGYTEPPGLAAPVAAGALGGGILGAGLGAGTAIAANVHRGLPWLWGGAATGALGGGILGYLSGRRSQENHVPRALYSDDQLDSQLKRYLDFMDAQGYDKTDFLHNVQRANRDQDITGDMVRQYIQHTYGTSN